jgi:hypothetical protein
MTYIFPLASNELSSNRRVAKQSSETDREWVGMVKSLKTGGKASSRSETFAEIGEIAGRTAGTVEGVAIGLPAGALIGGTVFGAVGIGIGFAAGGPVGATAAIDPSVSLGVSVGGAIGGVLEGTIMGDRGAVESSRVGRDFGNAAWDISHRMSFSDKVAAVSAYTWGLMSAPFARHVYSPIVDVVSGLVHLVSGVAKIAYRVGDALYKAYKASRGDHWT